MSWLEHLFEMLDEAADRTAKLGARGQGEASTLSRGRARRARKKHKRKRLVRLIKAGLAMVLAPFVIIPSMIASGLLLGPKGYEGIVLAPLVMIAVWAVILYWGLAKRTLPPPRALKADNTAAGLALLPAQTEEWLEQERLALPAVAQGQLDGLSQRLELITPQLQVLDPQAPAALEVRRLLSEELPELVRGYRKVPRALAQQPLYGGASPERQLLDGLDTIDKQIVRMHERLAADDLHALATHQRYLELKYKDGEDEDS